MLWIQTRNMNMLSWWCRQNENLCKVSCIHVLLLPIKRGLLPAVKGILKLFDQIGLTRQSEKTLFLKAPLANEVHTLLNQHRSKFVPKPALITHCVLQFLAEDPWRM